ncbi:MAG TPA: N-acetyltransferase [Candidatus Altiarchaeales archaeon]|nr:N-acetyltransferase [Candidatus Altiarchaeales archaeon]
MKKKLVLQLNPLTLAVFMTYIFEGKGYGTKVMNKFINFARKHGYESLIFIATKPAMRRIGEIGMSGNSPVMKLNLK